MVVPVLITNCHVSEKPKNGPDIIHIRITTIAVINAQELPVALVILPDNLSKKLCFGLLCSISYG